MKDIHDRLKRFAIRCIKLTQLFPQTPGSSRIASQLIGAATSPAANAREAHRSRSKAEFISTMGISLKEMSEARLWLEIIQELSWADSNETASLLTESLECEKILATIIMNTKRNP